VDARHKPTANDLIMTQWFQQTGCPFLVVANKLDKLKKSEIEPNLQLIRQTLDLSDDTKIIPFSAEKGTGRELLVAELEAVAAAADTSQE
jgi:GTP-binding protein